MSVVVPGITAPSSVACVRSLGRRGINVIVVTDDENTAAFSSKYCGERRLIPPPKNVLAYRDALLTLSQRPDVQTIIPVREEDVYVLSRYADEFAPHVELPIPPFETLRRTQDRSLLFEAAKEAGVSAPRTERLDEWESWDEQVVVKSRYNVLADAYLPDVDGQIGSGRGTTQYVETGSIPAIDEIADRMGHVPIVQEYIPNTDEYAFFALYERGEPVATFQHRQRRAYKYYGGPSSFRESTAIPALDEAGRQLLDHLEWHGLAMVEFLLDDATGEFKLMEVNPRFWSSLPFTIQTGVDFPYYYWLQARNAPVDVDPSYEVGIAGHLIRGELLYLHSLLFEENDLVPRPSRPRAFAAVARSLLAHRRFDYLDIDDPRPFVRDLANMIPTSWTPKTSPRVEEVEFREDGPIEVGDGTGPSQ